MILRNSYITKTGKKVGSNCITATSASGNKTSDEVIKYLKKKNLQHAMARKKFPTESKVKCKKGQIRRNGYYVKSHVAHNKTGKETKIKSRWVSPGCIKSQTNKSSKSPKSIVILEKNDLKQFGYANVIQMKKIDRRMALKKAIQSIRPLSIYRKLVALATLNKNEMLYKIFREDGEWIKKQQEYMSNKKLSKKLSKKSSKKLSKKSSKNI